MDFNSGTTYINGLLAGALNGNVTNSLNPGPPTSIGMNKTSPSVRLPVKPNLTAPRRTAAAKRKTIVENRIAPFARDIVAYQDVIYFFSNVNPQSPLRQQLLYGFDGAPKFDEVHFEMLIKMRELISGHHRINDILPNPQHFQEETVELKISSQHFTWLMNGEPTPIPGKRYSYADVKNLIERIIGSVYYGSRQTEQKKIAAEQQLQFVSNSAPANLFKPINGPVFEGMDNTNPLPYIGY